MAKGGRNLLFLGLAAIAISLTTTGVSLAIYHNSGDIYLDRSRPGFLPEKDESATEESEPAYEFEKSGLVTEKVLEEYLDALNAEIEGLEAYKDPFAPDALSDDRLGI